MSAPAMTQNSSPFLLSTQQWLDREAPHLPDDLRAAIEALYLAVEAGHVCIRVQASDAWLESGWVGAPASYAPFILEPDENGGARFYLARYQQHEAAVAQALRQRAAQPLQPADAGRLLEDLNTLFGNDPTDRQRLAALLAQFRPLTLVSGGPGTGKTTTVVKMLALLQAQAFLRDPAAPLRIALAAPTGKAAQRLSESIRSAKQKLALDERVIASIPENAQTLHRLLGAQGDTGRFRHGADQPLSCDLLLIDEASMIDLGLMQAVLAALPVQARLVLLGDRDQLASVEAGSVFGDLCAGGGMSAAMVQALAPFGVTLERAALPSVLGDCRVELTRSYRFAADSGIAALAKAAREGDVAAFLQALNAGGDVSVLAAARLRERVQTAYAPYLNACTAAADNPDKSAAFSAFLKFRVLCAHREGVAGVEGINALMEAGKAPWYAGRPVIIRANDYALRLFNGDIGLCLPTPDGLRVFFEGAPGEFRALAPGRLPSHEPAWAMTVHQSQGSEFEDVLLVLPGAASAVLDRPLIYTAVTRAKACFALCGDAAVLSEALVRLPARESGLLAKLAGMA